MFKNIQLYSEENLFDTSFCDTTNIISVTLQSKKIKQIEEKYEKKFKKQNDATVKKLGNLEKLRKT